MRQSSKDTEEDNNVENLYKRIAKNVTKSFNAQESRVRSKLESFRIDVATMDDTFDKYIKESNLKLNDKERKKWVSQISKFRFRNASQYYYDDNSMANENSRIVQRELDVKTHGTLYSSSDKNFDITFLGDIKDTNSYHWIFENMSDQKLDHAGHISLIKLLPRIKGNNDLDHLYYDIRSKRTFTAPVGSSFKVLKRNGDEAKHDEQVIASKFHEQIADGISNYIGERTKFKEFKNQQIKYVSRELLIPVMFISHDLLIAENFAKISEDSIQSINSIVYTHATHKKRENIPEWRLPILIIDENEIDNVLNDLIPNIMVRVIDHLKILK
jgi:hypothetical protein